MTSPSAARWTAEGKTSLDDWPMLTWSLGWAPSPARLAITSFAFMFEEVPEPVWKTSTGNCVVVLAGGDRVAGGGDPLGDVGVELAELGVDPRRGGLDPAEPVDHGRRDRLPGDREVLDRLRGLTAPELLGAHAPQRYLLAQRRDGPRESAAPWRGCRTSPSRTRCPSGCASGRRTPS